MSSEKPSTYCPSQRSLFLYGNEDKLLLVCNEAGMPRSPLILPPGTADVAVRAGTGSRGCPEHGTLRCTGPNLDTRCTIEPSARWCLPSPPARPRLPAAVGPSIEAPDPSR